MRSFPLPFLCQLWGHVAVQGMCRGVCVDTRLLEKGNLFFALPGAQVDGHSYLEDAAKKGASGAVVKEDYRGPSFGMPLIRVKGVLEAIQALAKHVKKNSQAQVVAVTGSIGKTTTKEFIATLLKEKYKVAHSPGNSNSQIGLPLAVLNHTSGDEDVWVIEMGMTHPGNLTQLVQIVPPDVALITMTTLVHACNFSGLEGIGVAKGEIFSHPKTRIGLLDYAIVNRDALEKIGTCRKATFAIDVENATYSLRIVGEKMILKSPQGAFELPMLPLQGSHNRHNFLAAAATALEMGVSEDQILAALSKLQLPERRLQFVEKNGALFVNDAYNACVPSIKGALESLPAPKGNGRKIAVLSEMAELGGFAEACHKEVGEHALQYVDLMLCFGPHCKTIKDIWEAAGASVEWFMTRDEIVQAVKRHVKPGDVVLLKGARSRKMDKILEEI